MMRETYTVLTSRNGGWWAIRVAELPAIFSQASRLAKVNEMARDAIALFLDVAPDSFDTDVHEMPKPHGATGQS
jgi:predicted RNase H-like HicB family nuclease